MKVKDLFDDNKFIKLDETAGVGMTTVQSLGTLEYIAKPNQIKLIRRSGTATCCVAKLKRKTHKGWIFSTTPEWYKNGFPHMGHIVNAKSPINGQKTISNNIESLLKQWGLNVVKVNKNQ